MEMDGIVQDGVIVPDGECQLPEGTKVRITAAETGRPAAPSLSEKLRQIAEKYEKLPCDLPADFSANHDHYVHGTPKRS